MILGGALNLRGMTGNEAQNSISNRLAQDKLDSSANSHTYGTPYEKNGRMVRDIEIGGNVVGEQDLGEKSYKPTEFKPDMLLDKDGNLYEHKVGEPVRPGSKKPSDPVLEMMRIQGMNTNKFNLDAKLGGYEAAIVTGKDKNGEIPDEKMQVYVDQFNNNSPDFEYVKQVSKPLKIGLREVPWTGGKVTWKKVPKVKANGGNAAFNNSTKQSQYPGAPAIGTENNGYRFKGGNHRDKNNWEKM